MAQGNHALGGPFTCIASLLLTLIYAYYKNVSLYYKIAVDLHNYKGMIKANDIIINTFSQNDHIH